ncbi:DNA sulfur modification protein DndB [Salisediminibacterium beveridgei]|uniref:DNA sulfur modification protein DndB n=1 Tax=Salisediminibacterium beveridgei TaxID=632773 RepID=A0A1D7QWX9_9BACI|nr:DNA sulfur modification protein DndB [Salisediminibacterium beveridgei]AOM83523.1 DNA sulfur modification protein DndB [Salisediminibacterium beveridgei]
MKYDFSYSFPAVRGLQAKRQYYIAMCPLKLIPKLFLFDEEEIPVEYRSQRVINRRRIPEISNYILENPDDYVFSSITASIDGDMEFISQGEDANQNVGMLMISMEARFLINDGQHRRAAIEEALNINPELGNETISVVFFEDQGLLRSQQLFSDLNKHAVNTTKSIGILYDSRDHLATITKNIIQENDVLRKLTDLESSSLSKFSPKVFTLSTIHSTNKRILGVKKNDTIAFDSEEFLVSFWDELVHSISEWNAVHNKELSASELRKNYICSYGIVLEAIGMIGHEMFKARPDDWNNRLKGLNKIDWSRNNRTLWLNRVYNQSGRINKNLHSIKLTKNQIKKELDLELNYDELEMEEQFLKEEY